jgi:multiple sugar transport system permease protein
MNMKRSQINKLREAGLGYLFLGPALILLLVFEIFPVFYGLYISMCDWRLSCARFVLFDNYVQAFSDPEMWHSLLVTATYALISIPLQLSLGLILAYFLFQKIKGAQFFRMIYFLPYITTTVASAAVWAYMFSPDIGPINHLLELAKLPQFKWLGEPRGIFEMAANSLHLSMPGWAAGPSLALVSLIVYTTWVFVGYDVVIFLAGLGNISKELYDAAKVDGASGWALFRYITLPLLSPTTYFLLVITVIGTFKAFNHIYMMTNGGPGNATTTSSLYIFKQMYQFNQYGYSAALSFIVFVVIMIMTVIQNNLANKNVNYD